MAKLHLFLVLFFSLSLSSQSHSQNPNPNPNPKKRTSAYDELRSSGFPVGLLPNSVLGYALNRTTGEFSVDISGGGCHIILPPDGYLASYAARVKGRLRDRRIAELDGIRVRALFRWWSITGIRSVGDDVVFEVGVASAKYPSKNFHESPECEGRTKASS